MAVNLIREYRYQNGLKQSELAEELKEILPGIDTPLLSKMERGLCEPPLIIKEYLLKALASPKLKRKSNNRINIPNELENVLKDEICELVYTEISKGNFCQPITKSYLKVATGLKDRQIRQIVENLRKAGARIYSSSSTAGYWLCESETQYKVLRNEMLGRARSILRTVAAMDNAMPGQTEMEIRE